MTSKFNLTGLFLCGVVGFASTIITSPSLPDRLEMRLKLGLGALPLLCLRSHPLKETEDVLLRLGLEGQGVLRVAALKANRRLGCI
jgi:hypothetical protein